MVVLLLVFLALIYDMGRGIIPNRLLLTGASIGLIMEFCSAGLEGVITGLLRLILSITVLFVLFLSRAMGAGDVKLYSLISIYIGMRRSLCVFVISIFLSGIYIIISTIIRFNSVKVVHNLAFTFSNFFISSSYKKKSDRTYYSCVGFHTIKMTPYILIAVVLVLYQ